MQQMLWRSQREPKLILIAMRAALCVSLVSRSRLLLNCQKQYLMQKEVAQDVATQIAAGDGRIMGVMVESHLNEGRQEHSIGEPLAYGQSITDACLGWADSVEVLNLLAAAVRERRQKSK